MAGIAGPQAVGRGENQLWNTVVAARLREHARSADVRGPEVALIQGHAVGEHGGAVKHRIVAGAVENVVHEKGVAQVAGNFGQARMPARIGNTIDAGDVIMLPQQTALQDSAKESGAPSHEYMGHQEGSSLYGKLDLPLDVAPAGQTAPSDRSRTYWD